MATTKIALADELAEFAHHGQKDKSGKQYMIHVQHVARTAAAAAQASNKALNGKQYIDPSYCYIDPSDCYMAGILHDVVEDSDVSFEVIRNLFGPTIGQAVAYLTRLDDETHAEYIRIIAQAHGLPGEIARIVKRADLTHNLSEERRYPGDESLRKRYIKALEVLG